MQNPIVDYVVTIVNGMASIFPQIIFFWFFISLVVYFVVIRGALKGLAIQQPKMTKKERKARLKEDLEREDAIDVILSGSIKRCLSHFARWLVCDCYREEDKTRWFGLFRVTCCICLVFFSVVSVLMILGAWITTVRLAAAIGMFICNTFAICLFIFCTILFWVKKEE